jgi:hypothetical protein
MLKTCRGCLWVKIKPQQSSPPVLSLKPTWFWRNAQKALWDLMEPKMLCPPLPISSHVLLPLHLPLHLDIPSLSPIFS